MMPKKARSIEITVKESTMTHEHHVWVTARHDYHKLVMWCMLNCEFDDWCIQNVHGKAGRITYDKCRFSFLEREDSFRFVLHFGGEYEHGIRDNRVR